MNKKVSIVLLSLYGFAAINAGRKAPSMMDRVQSGVTAAKTHPWWTGACALAAVGGLSAIVYRKFFAADTKPATTKSEAQTVVSTAPAATEAQADAQPESWSTFGKRWGLHTLTASALIAVGAIAYKYGWISWENAGKISTALGIAKAAGKARTAWFGADQSGQVVTATGEAPTEDAKEVAAGAPVHPETGVAAKPADKPAEVATVATKPASAKPAVTAAVRTQQAADHSEQAEEGAVVTSPKLESLRARLASRQLQLSKRISDVSRTNIETEIADLKKEIAELIASN